MFDKDVLINALKEGRKKFPKRGNEVLWDASRPNVACALGAIAVGLGYTPTITDGRYDYAAGYDFLKPHIAPLQAWNIYEVNDESFDGGVEIRNPDLAVIHFLENYHV